MTYKLTTGYHVTATRVDDHTTFETRNAGGDVISTVRLDAFQASLMHAQLKGASK